MDQTRVTLAGLYLILSAFETQAQILQDEIEASVSVGWISQDEKGLVASRNHGLGPAQSDLAELIGRGRKMQKQIQTVLSCGADLTILF